jgi:hypothetical protein
MRPVAQRRLGGPPCVREKSDIITELITTEHEREANYVHQGWSVNAASTISPLTSCRITNKNQPNRGSVWVTKRTVAQRLTFRILLEELTPVSEFEADIVTALEKPTTFETFQAIYRALHAWLV